MAYNHLTLIKSMAEKLSALTGKATAFLTASILNNSTFGLISEIGETEYGTYYEYLKALDDGSTPWDLSKLVYSMTDEEKKIDRILVAETYLAFYHLTLALKQVDIDSVMVDKKKWGQSDIAPVDLNKIIQMRDTWYNEYIKAISSSFVTGDDSASTGTLGVMVI